MDNFDNCLYNDISGLYLTEDNPTDFSGFESYVGRERRELGFDFKFVFDTDYYAAEVFKLECLGIISNL